MKHLKACAPNLLLGILVAGTMGYSPKTHAKAITCGTCSWYQPDEGGSIEFQNRSVSFSRGYLSFRLNSQACKCGTPYSDPTAKAGEPHSKNQYLDWPAQATDIKITMKADSVFGISGCIMWLGTSTHYHVFRVVGTLGGALVLLG